MAFHWSLSDSKSPQVSRTLLRILAVLNNAVVWMVSTRPPTSKSFSPFNNPLVTVPKAPIIIIIILLFWNFFILFQLMVFHWSLSDSNLLKSSGLFSVLWAIFITLSFGWSPLAFLFLILPVSLSTLWWLHRAHRLQLVSLSRWCSIVFFQFSSKVYVLISPFAFLQFYTVVSRNSKLYNSAGSLSLTFFIFLTITRSGRLAEMWLIVSSLSPHYYYHYYYYSLEFFTSDLADGLLLEIEWQQVSSSLQDSSQYSGRFQ